MQIGWLELPKYIIYLYIPTFVRFYDKRFSNTPADENISFFRVFVLFSPAVLIIYYVSEVHL